jgi:hypothetical protein
MSGTASVQFGTASVQAIGANAMEAANLEFTAAPARRRRSAMMIWPRSHPQNLFDGWDIGRFASAGQNCRDSRCLGRADVWPARWARARSGPSEARAELLPAHPEPISDVLA